MNMITQNEKKVQNVISNFKSSKNLKDEKVTYVDAWTILVEEDDVIFAVTRG